MTIRALAGLSLIGLAPYVIAQSTDGQSTDQTREFDVASVKIAGSTGKARVENSPGAVMIKGSFDYILAWAFDVKNYQISGPDWIRTERYDIAAKAAGPVSPDDLRRMLRALLAKRFKLQFHRENKDFAVYALTVAKGGPKLKESVTEGENSTTTDPKKPGSGGMSIRTSMVQLADLLDGSCPDPVIDRTGLKGRYDFNLDISPYLTDPQHNDIPAILAEALPKQLGLNLEHRKIPIAMLIVDGAEKVPVGN